jgi:pimeloyl-ACP methyl ester carboxylesterase
MPKVVVNGIEIAYEFKGSRDNPVLLLVHGLGSPLTAWPESFVDCLVDEGFCVLRYDNRDVGHSQQMDALGNPNMLKLWFRNLIRLPAKPPYSLEDMMTDAKALLEALEIDKVHVVGASLGGMISQLLAIHAPEKVLTLTSIMSTTGNRNVPGPTQAVSQHLMSRPSEFTAEAILAHNLKTWSLIGSPDYVTPEDVQVEYVKGILERGLTGAGVARQMAAIMSAKSRVKALQKLKVPSLVIHGDADPLVRVEGGYDTAKAIPNARLEIIPGMGHDFPPQLQPQICELISTHVKTEQAA